MNARDIQLLMKYMDSISVKLYDYLKKYCQGGMVA